MFNNTFEYKLHAPPVKDPEGRFCILDLTLFQQRFTLAVVYGPNNDDPNFFLQLSEKIGAVGYEAVIAVGDWNVVLDYEWDTAGYKHKNNPKANVAVLDLMKILDLGGIYRTLHPDKYRFTWRKGRKESQMSRLDNFLISPEFYGFVTEAHIDISYRSDHSLITVDLNFITQERGKGYWEFNNLLLYDPESVKKVKETINETVSSYRLPENEVLSIDDQMLFELIKLQVRGITISHSSYKKRLKRERKIILRNGLLNYKKYYMRIQPIVSERR